MAKGKSHCCSTRPSARDEDTIKHNRSEWYARDVVKEIVPLSASERL
jgi:hypothetical protein